MVVCDWYWPFWLIWLSIMNKIVQYWLISFILDKNLTTLEEATKYYSAIFFFCQGGFSLPSLTLASPCSWPHGRTLGLASLARLDQIKFIQSKDKLFMSMITFTRCLWTKEMTFAVYCKLNISCCCCCYECHISWSLVGGGSIKSR